jgi:2-polyprenyl-3-methyl-5-hydroxy-6-metoxy-1,4-benzoquinol methylase
MNYRDRCYQTFVSTHWQFSHSLSKENFEFIRKAYRQRYGSFLPENKTTRILDLACGMGYFLYYLQQEGYTNYWGIDISKEQLEIARAMGITQVQEADLHSYLPQHQEEFDLIIANDIIEHFTKDEIIRFLDLLYSALKPGGQVIISTANMASLYGARTAYLDFTHETGFTPESLAQILRVCKFAEVKVYGENPIIHDFSSLLRAGLWWILVKFQRLYFYIERGTGRQLWKEQYIFTPRIFAVAEKPNSKP